VWRRAGLAPVRVLAQVSALARSFGAIELMIIGAGISGGGGGGGLWLLQRDCLLFVAQTG